MARRNANRADEKYGVLRDISSNWSPTRAARLLVEFEDRVVSLRRIGSSKGAQGGSNLVTSQTGVHPMAPDVHAAAIEGARKGWWTGAGSVVSPEMLDVLLTAGETLGQGDVDFNNDLDHASGSGSLLLPRAIGRGDGTPHLNVQLLTWFRYRAGHDLPDPLVIQAWAPKPFELDGPRPGSTYPTLVGSEVLMSGTDGGHRGSRLPRILFTFLRLAEQRTTAETVERVPADPGTPKRAPRPEQDVRVTYLRRAASSTRPAGTREVDWSSRWVVSMHKARQWYPKEKKHKIIFRGPYVKGPADKPLRTTPSVKALVR